MFSGCANVVIKNEPIDTDDTDFSTNELFHQKVAIKCEVDDDSYDLINSSNWPKTVICSENEYLAEGNAPFESIVVKEEEEHKYYIPPVTFDTFKYSPGFVGKAWECYICRHQPSNAIDLRRHFRTHHLNHVVAASKKLVTCEVCGGKFANIYRHRVVHKGVRSFPCDQCDRKFFRSSTLTQHKRSLHSGMKPYICCECGRKFADPSVLRRHKQTHSKELPFACHLCDRRCARKSTLIRHLNTHTGTKSFVCNVCGKKFSRNSTLNHHKMFHTGQFPYECNVCSRKFPLKSSLSYHLQTHNKGEKPFKCEKCTRTFGSKSTLNQHMKIHILKATKSRSNQQSAESTQQERNIINESTRKGVSNVPKTRITKNSKLSKCSRLMNKCKSLRKI